jgi:pyruvate/2-oxoglutarate dehydrogenase complex dihydrolipoamide acyltransferase (E2) component
MRPEKRPVGASVVLGVTVAVNAVLYYAAGADASFAVEPTPYAKPVTRDSTPARPPRTATPQRPRTVAPQPQRTAALGWRLSPALTPIVQHVGARLSITLADATGAPITDAIVKVSATSTARAGTVLESVLLPDTNGYNTILGIAHAGSWEFRFDVTRQRQHFASTVRLDAVSAAPRL